MLRYFKIVLHLHTRSAYFYETMTRYFKRFQSFNFETIFPKTMKTFFEKLEYHFLVESTTIESTTYLYKTDLSKANVKTNRMGSTKWTYHKKAGFPLTT